MWETLNPKPYTLKEMFGSCIRSMSRIEESDVLMKTARFRFRVWGDITAVWSVLV